MQAFRPIPLLVAASMLVFGAAAGAADAPAPGSAAASAAHARALARLCDGCALVASVRTQIRKGKPTGVGAVGGAVVGGVLGHQVGKGGGNTVATIGGAAVGGLAGNEIEKHMKKYTVWITTATMRDGTKRSFEATANPGLKAGDVVTVSANGGIKKKV